MPNNLLLKYASDLNTEASIDHFMGDLLVSRWRRFNPGDLLRRPPGLAVRYCIDRWSPPSLHFSLYPQHRDLTPQPGQLLNSSLTRGQSSRTTRIHLGLPHPDPYGGRREIEALGDRSDAPPFANELDRSNPRFRRLLSPDPGIPVNSLSGIECFRPPRGTTQMPGTIVPVLLALMFFGTLPARPHRQRWGYAARDVLGTAVLRAVFGLGALLVCGAASAQSVVGVTTANLQWAAASGPVAGYAVFIARNGAPYPARPTFTTSTTTAQVAGAYGDTITVKVAA